ncbi:MAG: T9SS type A sorting domain-containing protein [Bacteroidia bacterium]|nr:T9SS type A sorting domain-containing protein [Bacteroidia bacterium]
MKYLVLSILYVYGALAAGAQNFILGAADSHSDMTQAQSSPPDVKAIYYAFDTSMDSLWFKMEFFTKVSNKAWSAKVGIDTNNIADGAAWPAPSVSQSLRYDVLVDIYYNPGFPPPFTGNIYQNTNYISSNVNLRMADTNVVVVGLKRSQIKQAGIPIRFVAGAGLIVGTVNDEVPDQGYVVIQELTTGITEKSVTDLFVFPNPANDFIFLNSVSELENREVNYNIVNDEGKIVLAGKLKTKNRIDIRNLQPANYFLFLEVGGEALTKKIIVEKK